MDCTLSGSWNFAYGIFQARILEQVAISYSRGSSQQRDRIHIFCVSCTGRQILYHWATWEAHISVCGYIFFFIFLFHYGLSQDTESSSLYYTVGPCCLSILYIHQFTSANSKLPLLSCPTPFPLATTSLFSRSLILFLLLICLSFLLSH